MKKVLSIILSLSLALSLSVSAFAAETAAEENDGAYESEVTVDGAIVTPTIAITVSTSANVILNPYAMEVYALDGTTQVTDTVISAGYGISSVSNVDVDVSLTTSAKLGGDVELAAAETEITDTTKEKLAFLYVDFIADATYAEATGWDTEGNGYSADTDFIVTEKAAKTATKVATLDAVTGTFDTSNKWTADAGEASTLGFTIGGALNDTPEVPWTSEDTVTITLAFTFTPAAAATT